MSFAPWPAIIKQLGYKSQFATLAAPCSPHSLNFQIMIFTLSSCDDPHIVIWWSSNHQGGHYQAARPWISIRYASPCSPLILNFQWCKLHFLISSSAIASMHHSVQFQSNFCMCKGNLCFNAFVGAISCMAKSLEGNFYVCKGILCFFALVGAISRVISVCARAFYVSMLLCVQGQFNMCVQGHSILLFGAISM